MRSKQHWSDTINTSQLLVTLLHQPTMEIKDNTPRCLNAEGTLCPTTYVSKCMCVHLYKAHL